MKYLKRTISEWLTFFNKLNDLVKEQQRDIVSKTYLVLKRLNNQELTNITNEYQVINLLTKLGIEKLEIALSFLNTLKDYYSYDKLIQEIKDINELYALTHLAFIYDNSNLIKITEFFTLDCYRKVYTAPNNIPLISFDLNTNGLNIITLKAHNPFIIDELDLSNKSPNNRTFYTSNFLLNKNLPHKEELNLFSIHYERNKLFKELIKYLSTYPLVNLYIKEPNIDLPNNYTKTIRCDGLLLDEDNEELIPKESYYLSSKVIKIRHANFCLIYDQITKEIFLYIKRSYYEEIIKDEEIKNILTNFNESPEKLTI